MDGLAEPRSTGPRSWAWGTAGAVAATSATIAAVTWVTAPAAAPGGGLPEPDGEQTSQQLVTVYFVGGSALGPRLFGERRQFGGRSDALPWSVANVVAGNALDPDHSSSWPAHASVRGALLQDGLVTVDLGGPVVRRPASLPRADAAMALQQVVRTAQSVTGTHVSVRFLHDGQPTETVLGQPTRAPVRGGTDDAVLAPVSVSSPAEQSMVVSPFTVTGRTTSPLRWELRSDSVVVRRGRVGHLGCCALAPYWFTVSAPVGSYTLTVRGRGGSVDTRDIRVDPPE